jgi:hypothetical protein
VASNLYVGWIPPDGGNARKNNARLQAQNLHKACKSYRTITGTYPNQLSDLLELEGRPLIDGGKWALIEPWNNPFRYELRTDSEGEMIPYVWSEHVENGRTKVIGWPKDFDEK